ncbi:maleylacetoacetate isomerase/maleylpyruvate isomerase [Rhodothalassium salexigens DSM 2132]|uniref:Maleylacetoacetate isomerase/maleylpyruvate isomerase n=1 Tax=Rhodothalassium salexigens DSM 2132 TaxID=1188247 RepID=A0A4R2PHV7_RHOSA|nr:maleylacetoacetate isomerase [Rhodothalassium salexigens]MBB4211881.1 maleylacetoacetate isomerase [Rhodothalassium salexigens DSM 2132]MBK1638922.1 maleylacetoacetate isomerase [Rhodothalassium salexigens DSM 2132]TCP33535.1 maleylacetoacetate isomerase/maleylpyruvate isomerase [Rhodothalassium salexigens DSM 2132]
MKLYTYYRSSAAFRVRIALNLKGLEAVPVPVHLARGEQAGAAYRARNPQALVPALELDDGRVLTQSMAILEYLDETVPEPALLPADPVDRARVRAMADLIACDIHPLNNLRVLTYLKGPLDQTPAAVGAWYGHWVRAGFAALETLVAAQGARFCWDHRPGLADLCLVPQMWNARRFEVPLDDFPTLVRIDAELRALPAFAASAPEVQPDAPAA